MEGGQYPATATIDYLKLAAAQVGEMQAQLATIRANIEQADDDIQVVYIPMDYATYQPSGFTPTPGGAAMYPDGKWKSIVILWPSDEYYNGQYGNASLQYTDIIYTGSSGFTAMLQPNPTALPIFDDKWGRLFLYTNGFGKQHQVNAVPAVLSKREYWSAPTFAGY